MPDLLTPAGFMQLSNDRRAAVLDWLERNTLDADLVCAIRSPLSVRCLERTQDGRFVMRGDELLRRTIKVAEPFPAWILGGDDA